MSSPKLLPVLRKVVGLLVLAFVLGSTTARAQQIEPRAYSNAPTGVNFLLAGYGRAEGALVVDESVPLEDANLVVNMMLTGFVRTLDLWGLHAKANVIVPYAWLSGTAQVLGEPLTREVDGFGDVAARLSVNFVGSPALSLAEFATYRQGTIVGASVHVSAPTGQYETGKLVNIGTNRWLVRTEVGLSHVVEKWTLELATAASFFGDNDDFFPGGAKREQAPTYAVQGGFVYSLPRGMWTALNGSYFTGGESTVNGVEGDDRQSNTRVAWTFTYPVSRHHSAKFFAATGVSTRTGGDYDLFSIMWQYRWGGGL
jgi:hypothetical protein